MSPTGKFRAGHHWLLIGVLACFWVGAVVVVSALPESPLYYLYDPAALLPAVALVLMDDVFPVLLVFVVIGTSCCYLGHRLFAALMFSVWLMRRELADFRWAAKVISYEVTFIWVFCVYWGLLLAAITFSPGWISQVLGFSLWSGVGEMLAILSGTGALGIVWLVRYEIAYRSIRWSNF